ncbi:MAG: ETC complex I subunit [Alphaproteobacteria bacterium]|nr:ETC complex I subunit [Alphaproteobacteria bacterium]
MSRVRIFQQPKTAMQSGRAGTDEWLVQFELEQVKITDAGMQWQTRPNTNSQLKLKFATLSEAEEWAKSQGHSYHVLLPQKRNIKPKAYADNFAYQRTQPWTH